VHLCAIKSTRVLCIGVSLFKSLQSCMRHVSKLREFDGGAIGHPILRIYNVGQNNVSSCCSARVANLPCMSCRFARTAFPSASSSFPLRSFGLWSRGQGLRVQGSLKATGSAWWNRLRMQISAGAAGAGAGVWRGGGLARRGFWPSGFWCFGGLASRRGFLFLSASLRLRASRSG